MFEQMTIDDFLSESPKRLNVLLACEESQVVCIEFRKLGHRAFSCDIQACSGGHPEWHIMGDVLKLINGRCSFMTMDGRTHTINDRWDLIIAFPPCTYISNAGACRLYPKKGQLDLERYKKGLAAKKFFLIILNADCPRVAVENPVSSKVFDMPIHTQEIQPYEFDSEKKHPYTKKTRIWIRGDLKPLRPTTPNAVPIGPYVPSGTGRKDQSKYGYAKRGDDAKNRAKTPIGIGIAMAWQWGGDCRCSI